MKNHGIPLLDPHIRLYGTVNDAMFRSFVEQLNAARTNVAKDQPLVLEITTTGGDAECGRRIATDVMLCREHEGRRMVFVGKTVVYSAGVSIMSGFKPRDRFLVRETELLIHERRIDKEVKLTGALRSNMPMLRDVMAELESGNRLECLGFAQLVEGTSLSADELLKKVMHADWYLQAEEAKQIGLVHDVL